MLTRDNLILPEYLMAQRGMGVLDTPEKVRSARKEYLSLIEPAIAEINKARRIAMENYGKRKIS